MQIFGLTKIQILNGSQVILIQFVTVLLQHIHGLTLSCDINFLNPFRKQLLSSKRKCQEGADNTDCIIY